MFSPSDYNDAVPQFTNGNYANEPQNPLYVEEPDAVNYKKGVEPLQTLPAQWWNWLWNKITAKLNNLNIYVKNIFNELAGLLSLVNVTPDATEKKVTTGQLKDMFKTKYPQYLNDNFDSEVLFQGRNRGVIVAPTDTWDDTTNTLSLTGGFGIVNYHKVTFSDCNLVIPNEGSVHYIVSNTNGVISLKPSLAKDVILIGLCRKKEYCLLIDNNLDQCKDNIILKKWFGQNIISSNILKTLKSYYNTNINSIETELSISTTGANYGIYGGTFNNCTINIETVSGVYGIRYGTFNNCTITIKTVSGDYGIVSGTFNNCTITIETVSGGTGIRDCTFNNSTITIKTVSGDYGIVSGTFNNCTINIETVSSGVGIRDESSVVLNYTYIKCSAITSLFKTAGKLNVLNDKVFPTNSYGLLNTAALANSRFEYKDITDEFDAGTVSTDIANNDFTKYSVGNYIKKTITIPAYKNGTTDVAKQTVTVRIVFAHFNLYYSGVLPDVGTAYTENTYANVMTPHVACVICDLPNCAMNSSNTTSGGYFGSYMHGTFLKQVQGALYDVDILPQVHLVGHKKLLTTSINDSGYNRFGSNSGCSNNWEWKDNQYISLMSEVQLYGSIVWSSSGYDTGEANEKLALFNHIRPNKLLGNKNIWLRDVASATYFAYLCSYGHASNDDASVTYIAPAPLILLK